MLLFSYPLSLIVFAYKSMGMELFKRTGNLPMTIPLKKKMIPPPQSPLTTNGYLRKDGVLWFSPLSIMGCWWVQSCAGLMHVITGVACSLLHWPVHGSKMRWGHFTVLCPIFQFLHFFSASSSETPTKHCFISDSSSIYNLNLLNM